MNFPIHNTEINAPLPVSYTYEPCEKSKKGILLLHGYADKAISARKRLLGLDSIPSYHVLAPNGFFPTPLLQANGSYKEAYAWYFYDPQTGTQLIAPEKAAKMMMSFLKQIALEDLEWTVLSFSQGGFFSPYLLRAGLKAKTLISVGAAYRTKALESLSPDGIKIYAIHGMDDRIVDHDASKKSFEEIQKLGFQGEYYSLPGLAHSLNEEGRKIVSRILLEGAGA